LWRSALEIVGGNNGLDKISGTDRMMYFRKRTPEESRPGGKGGGGGAWVCVAVVIVVVVMVAGCVGDKKYGNREPIFTQTPQKTPESTLNNESKISSSIGNIIEKYSLEKLVLMADSIAVGEVTNISPSKWNTPDGKKPVGVNNASYVIYTDIYINIIEYLRNPDTTVIVIRVLGGTVGHDRMEFEDQPSYDVNEKMLIFLREDADPRTKSIEPKHFVTAGLLQGKIPISQNGELIIGDEKMSIDELRVKIEAINEKSHKKE
jgi:hypothetical protein